METKKRGRPSGPRASTKSKQPRDQEAEARIQEKSSLLDDDIY